MLPVCPTYLAACTSTKQPLPPAITSYICYPDGTLVTGEGTYLLDGTFVPHHPDIKEPDIELNNVLHDIITSRRAVTASLTRKRSPNESTIQYPPAKRRFPQFLEF